MKAVRIHQHGGPEVLTIDDIAEPTAGPGEIVLDVKAISVNHLDLWVRRGMPGVRIPLPRRLGSDAAGVVAAVGPDVKDPKPGDRVLLNPGISCGHCEFCAGGEGSLCLTYTLLGEHCDGTAAQRIAVPARNAYAIPAGLTFEEAAALPLVTLTAWRMLVTRAQLKAGEDVLIVGAGAGVGTAAIQIARLCGARVIATAGSAAKLERARALGADVGIDHSREPVDQRVREITGKRGVDVVVDYVGKATWQTSLRCLRRGGRLVTCGATTGFNPEEDLRHIFYRQISVLGSTMGSGREFRDMLRAVARGGLKAVVDRAWPIERVADAHRALEAREVFGKVVLTVGLQA